MKTKNKFITAILFFLVLGITGVIAGSLGVIDLEKALNEKQREELVKDSVSKGMESDGTEEAIKIIQDKLDLEETLKQNNELNVLIDKCRISNENRNQCIDALERITFIDDRDESDMI